MLLLGLWPALCRARSPGRGDLNLEQQCYVAVSTGHYAFRFSLGKNPLTGCCFTSLEIWLNGKIPSPGDRWKRVGSGPFAIKLYSLSCSRMGFLQNNLSVSSNIKKLGGKSGPGVKTSFHFQLTI